MNPQQPLTWPVETTTDLPPGHPDAPPPPLVPGVEYGIDPVTGARVPVGYEQAAPAQPTVAAVDTRISGRAKGAALLTASAGASVTAVTLAVGQVAPQLGTAGHAIEAAGIGVGVAAAGVVLLKSAFGIGGKRGQTVIHHTETHHHTTTANGMFARARSDAPRISR